MQFTLPTLPSCELGLHLYPLCSCMCTVLTPVLPGRISEILVFHCTQESTAGTRLKVMKVGRLMGDPGSAARLALSTSSSSLTTRWEAVRGLRGLADAVQPGQQLLPVVHAQRPVRGEAGRVAVGVVRVAWAGTGMQAPSGLNSSLQSLAIRPHPLACRMNQMPASRRKCRQGDEAARRCE